MSSNPYHVEQLPVVQYPLVNKFYKDTGYGGNAGREELVYVVRNPGGIVAAVRLQPKSDGWLFLRAMCVAPQLRGQGVGRLLLQGLGELLSSQAVYCYPFDHLVSFYTAGGFQLLDAEQQPAGLQSLPHFMTEALQRYQQQGRKVCLMVHDTGLQSLTGNRGS
ncbi:GNAT family N-acetyltransferase [Pseudomaricurvus sp. HS19]|uniref:GNAT family N-acetyltransferase n=1 Tax=Pseudomaricurvus sp. HS19 TaxID=2692626 RepID=UPI0013684EE9|nr:GNAT family N-acetyltransferase [Pseudomaricurvus sp. HS19]MYM62777.1 GNAT family N-acetyltransferase [Pseudomaricurvus sp. HS19]